MANRVLGIDLGTVNSCVAVVRDGRAVVLGDTSDGGQRVIPSCLSFQRGKEVVGSAAKRQSVTDPHNSVAAVKRLLGHAYETPEVQAARERVPYPIRPSPLGSVLLEVGGKELTPVQVSARILQRIKQVAEEALGEPVSQAVISVPAHFNDVQRKATKMAAEYAGLEAIRLINEPTAAAFAYGYKRGEDFTLAVYDFGGGTFDITVMTARGDTFEVDATDGDAYLGGEDFDHAVVDWLLSEFSEQFGADLRGDEEARLRLKDAAERAKVELSELEQAQIDLPFLTQLPDGTRPNFSRALTREKFEELTKPLIDRTLALCKDCLREAGLQSVDVQEVLLVGGQTRSRAVRDAVKGFFGRDPRRDINPDEVVALGAALYAYSLVSDDLKEEAVEEAGEAYAVAVRASSVARKIIDDVEAARGDDASSQVLARRLEELLEQVEADSAEPASAPSLHDADLPAAVDRMRDELLEIERKVEEVVAEVRSSEDESATGVQAVDAMAGRLSEQIAAAHGAAERAQDHLSEAEQHASARKVELIDVTSHSLGVGAAADVFSVLIHRNTRVPVEKAHLFTTHQDGQTEVEIRAYQGSHSRASENQDLGNFVLEGIAPAPRLEPKIEVTFRIDEDGILSVRARDSVTGLEQGMRIEDPLALRHEDPAAAHEELIEESDPRLG